MEDTEDDSIGIENIYYSPFTQGYFQNPDSAIADRLNYASLFNEFQTQRDNHPDINYIPVYQEDTLVIDSINIYCMNSFQRNILDVNSNSLVLRLEIKGISIIITGDITDDSIEQMLRKYPEDDDIWDVDILQIPHHGYIAGISNDKLYQLTMPKYALLDCAQSEYEKNAVNILEQEKWVIDLGIEVFHRFEGPNQIIIK